jgi:6-phosphogluconolactonase
MTAPTLEVVVDADALTTALVSRIVDACHHAVATNGRFVVALAGGRTPVAAYRSLAERSDLPWERVVVTWGDERWVPRDDPDRNERAARTALLDHVPIPPDQVLGWPDASDPDASARAHATLLTHALGDPPRFDLVLLGLGADAHTASLFPGTGAVHASGLTTVVRPPGGGARLSLTAAALGNAGEVLVVVSGADKRDALRRTLHAAEPSDALPLTALRPAGRFVVLADEAAAGRPSGPADGVAVER